MHQYLEDLHNLLNWEFQMITAQYCKIVHGWIILWEQDKQMCFNVTEHEKFIDIVSHSSLQLTFKKLALVKF